MVDVPDPPAPADACDADLVEDLDAPADTAHVGVVGDRDASADACDAERVEDLDAPADTDHGGAVLDRAALADRASVPAFVVDLAIDAGLIRPLDNGDDGERFGTDHVEMLAAARTLIDEGVAVEEMAALAMRHATNVENLIDDAIDLLKRSINRDRHDRAELISSVNRLIPVASQLVIGHFEKTLLDRAMARIGDDPDPSAGAIVVKARRTAERVDPLAVYASAGADQHRSVWLRPDADMGLAAIGVAEAIMPVGGDRFSAASAARAVLAARIRREAADDAPAPVLVGGFSFSPTTDDLHETHPSGGESAPERDCGFGVDAGLGHHGGANGDAGSEGERGKGAPAVPRWDGYGDCWLVLPELTVIDGPGGTWLLAATRVGADGDEAPAMAELERRLEAFESAGPVKGIDTAAVPASAESATLSVASRASMEGSPADGDPVAASDDAYNALVTAAVQAIAAGEFQKVVMARTVALDRELDVPAVLDRLRRLNGSCATFAFSSGSTTFLGSTPEELVALDGDRLRTVALAGTAPRGRDADADERFGAELLASAKNRSEHRFVVDGIIDALSGLGLVDPAPAEPGLMRLSRVQHLRTPITAQVQRRRTGASDMDVLRAAGVLHPTAAVGGAPTEAALGFIADHEGFDRGWYAAPVGWCDLDGNGELGVALRCALSGPGGTHLFAGAGIVADSDPDDELTETALKLRALLDVVGER